MKKYVFFSLIILFFLCLGKAYSQTAEPLQCYSKGAIATYDGKRYFVEDIQFYDDIVTFLHNDGKQDTMQLSDISKVRAKSGTFVLEGTLIGVSICLYSSLLASLSVEIRNEQDDFDYWLPSLVATAVGTSLGALVGLCIPKYRDVFVSGRYTSLPNNYMMNKNLGSISQNILSINIRF